MAGSSHYPRTKVTVIPISQVDFDCPNCDTPYLKIESLLPGPIGIDSGNETIKLKYASTF